MNFIIHLLGIANLLDTAGAGCSGLGAKGRFSISL